LSGDKNEKYATTIAIDNYCKTGRCNFVSRSSGEYGNTDPGTEQQNGASVGSYVWHAPHEVTRK
jgi:hypothetical protein